MATMWLHHTNCCSFVYSLAFSTEKHKKQETYGPRRSPGKPFQSIDTFAKSFDYTITLIKREKNFSLLISENSFFSVCQRTPLLDKLFFFRNRKHSDVKDILGESRVLPHSSSKFNSMLTESNPNYALLTERTVNECIRNIPFTNIHLET